MHYDVTTYQGFEPEQTIADFASFTTLELAESYARTMHAQGSRLKQWYTVAVRSCERRCEIHPGN
jgi:hypothetical protein